MKKILNYIESRLPNDIEGFQCIKTQKILIPYMEIGIEVLTRDISDIGMFFENILSLVEVGIKEINEIGLILGVDFEIVKEAVVDMAEGDYVVVSENKLRITQKGKKIIEEKKIVEIRKTHINRMMINLITGEICDADNLNLQRPNRDSVCLQEAIRIDQSFVDSNFKVFNEFYKFRQEQDSVFGTSAVTRELYKIIGITYTQLNYIQNDLWIYKANDSNEFQLHFSSDSSDKYQNCIYEQLKEQTPPCLENFFERDRCYIEQIKNNTFIPDQNLLNSSINAKNELKQHNKVYDLNPFLLRRYSLTDKEYISYFVYNNSLNYKRIILCINRLKNVINYEIIREFANILEKKEIYLIYNKNEYKAKEDMDRLEKNLNSKNLHIIPCNSIKRSVILFQGELSIEIYDYILPIFGKSVHYSNYIIDFDKKYQEKLVESVIAEHNLSLNEKI